MTCYDCDARHPGIPTFGEYQSGPSDYLTTTQSIFESRQVLSEKQLNEWRSPYSYVTGTSHQLSKARFIVLFAHIVCDTCLSDPC